MTQGSHAANLNPDSYTAVRLQHATPEHLHLTSRRCFIGPVPIGWLRHHRREWYRHHLHINYSSRGATFDADPNTGRHRRTSELDQRQEPPRTPPANELDEEDEQGEEVAGPAPSSTKPVTLGTRVVARASVSENPPAVRSTENHLGAIATRSPGAGGRRPPKHSPGDKGTNLQAPNSPTKSRPAISKSPLKSDRGKPERRASALSFVTARTSLSTPGVDGQDDEEQPSRNTSTQGEAIIEEQSSLAPLLTSKPTSAVAGKTSTSHHSTGLVGKIKSSIKTRNLQDEQPLDVPADAGLSTEGRRSQLGLVRFNVPEEQAQAKEHYVRGKLAQLSLGAILRHLHRDKMQDGEILKLEKMLVRVEYTDHDLPPDFDENDSNKIDSRTVDKWKQFMVVCRDYPQEDSEFVLQLYKSRVIKAIEQSHVKRNSAYEIKLRPRTTRIGLFSTLDKTIVLWEPHKSGYRFYVVRPRSSANAMEWFTFIRGLLGTKPPDVLSISVPDLNVNLLLDHPFEGFEKSLKLERAISGDDDAIDRTIQEEKAIAQNIINRCLDMLKSSPEWTDVIKSWTNSESNSEVTSSAAASSATLARIQTSSTPVNAFGHEPVGLAWKRFDRLEWIHSQMYGTIGMERTHELELRPKQHYPTSFRTTTGDKVVEPPPVEGFLIRLTSQRGVDAKLGRLFFKRLYFSTHNQYLLFNKPAQADPPPPPKLPLTKNAKVPESREIVEKTPLIYSITPYQLKDGRISWLNVNNPLSAEEVATHDADAFDEAERTINLLLKCDGNLNLCDIRTVRHVQRGAIAADENVDEGSDVDFHMDLDDGNDEDDGVVRESEDSRTFELVLINGLIIRLQAFDETTKHEWMKRLRALIKYWKLRQAADMALYREVRHQNLKALNVDEEMEARIGQIGRKWEVGQSYASAEMYNMCGISCCRTVTMSGELYRKPRMHGTFLRNLVILSHGHLVIFRDTLRTLTGKKVAQIHHERLTSLDLRDCYIYSGLVTANDLLYSEQAPDSGSRPGYRGLPRMYPEDGWTSTDEDTMTCFVIWHSNKTSWFRSDKSGSGEKRRSRLMKVSQLGVEGRSIVFKARSRAERDHWVVNIGMEIERLSREEDVRIVQQ